MAKGIDWIKIRTEYETGNISQRKIADKYKVSYNTLQVRSKKECWAKNKEEIHAQITAKTRQKTAEKTIEKVSAIVSDRNAKFLQLSDLASSAIEEYLTEKHYKQHVVKYKYYDEEGKADREELQAVELIVADTKALANMIASLDKVQTGQRKAEGLDKAIELEKLKIEQRKLELLIAKAGDSDDSVSKSNDNIVMLAGLLNDPVETRTVDEFSEDE